MSHNYLLHLGEYVDTRIKSLTAESEQTPVSSEERWHQKGRLEALVGFQSLLCRDFYPRLPRRLYRTMLSQNCEALITHASEEDAAAAGDR